MKIEELFGTLQQSMVETWRSHLKTNKYSEHIALDEFYSDIIDKVDALIENWVGTHEKIETFTNILTNEKYTSLEYMQALRDVCIEGRELMDMPELESAMDDILSLIDRTIYKLKELTESKITSLNKYTTLNNMRSLVEYLNEAKRNVPENIRNAIKQGMKHGYIEYTENGKQVKYGISRENILSIIDYNDKYTQKDVEDLIADYEDNNTAKFKFEKDEEWKKAGYKDPNED